MENVKEEQSTIGGEGDEVNCKLLGYDRSGCAMCVHRSQLKHSHVLYIILPSWFIHSLLLYLLSSLLLLSPLLSCPSNFASNFFDLHLDLQKHGACGRRKGASEPWGPPNRNGAENICCIRSSNSFQYRCLPCSYSFNLASSVRVIFRVRPFSVILPF